MKGRILFLVEGSAEKGHSPAARFRVFQFLPRYREDGWSCDALWSFPMKYFAAAPFFRKIRTRPFLFYPLAVAAVLCMASHRLLQIVTRAPLADIVVVQRNLLPVRGFPLLEWLAARLAGKMVFDFDDAIFTEARDPGVRHGDVPRILRWADEVVAGNGYLAGYAREHNPRVTVVPTVPPAASRGRRPRRDRPVLGWIGTAPNIPYLLSIAPALSRLAAAVPFRILTVSDGPVALPPGIDHDHRAWSLKEEARFFDEIDVGLMPLPDDAWTRGKCAFKAIECLSRGIPAVVSPVGANREIGAEGEGALFASTENEWEEKLSRLCADPAYRDAVGGRGRETAAARFSPDSAAAAYLAVFGRRIRDNGPEGATGGRG